jgi:hypothetical protein
MNKKIVVLLLFGFIVLLCFGLPRLLKSANPDPVGEGQEARSGKKLAEFVIAVIEKGKETNNVYPESLDAILPLFSEDTQRKINALHMTYTPDETGSKFVLTFSCTDDGLVTCSWRSEKQSWTCVETE